MPEELANGKPTTRRYSDEEKAAAVRMVRTLRAELGVTHCGSCNHLVRNDIGEFFGDFLLVLQEQALPGEEAPRYFLGRFGSNNRNLMQNQSVRKPLRAPMIGLISGACSNRYRTS